MKKLFALSLCMLMIAMLFVGCATQEVEKRYTKMMALEPIIDSSEPYTMRVNTFSVELIDILNAGEWSEDNVANGGYDFKFFIDDKELFYNSSTGVVVDNGEGMILSPDERGTVNSIVINMLSRKISPEERLKDTVAVLSGGARITPKRFLSSATYTEKIDAEIEQVTNVCGSGCIVIYDYTTEQLNKLPTIKLDGEIKLELSEDVTLQGVVLTRIGRDVAEDEAITLDQLAALEVGEYYVYLKIAAENEISLEENHDVFRLIIE